MANYAMNPREQAIREHPSTFDLLSRLYARAVGHTTAVIRGAEATNAVVIVANHQQDRLFPKTVKTITLDEVETTLPGMHRPILLDNYVIERMAVEVRQREDFLLTLITRYRAALERCAEGALVVEERGKLVNVAKEALREP